MRSSFPNPWVEVILEQMWIVRQSTDLVARVIDPELLMDPQAMVDYCLHPSAERLNPLEFHGRRRLSAQCREQAGPSTNDARACQALAGRHGRQ